MGSDAQVCGWWAARRSHPQTHQVSTKCCIVLGSWAQGGSRVFPSQICANLDTEKITSAQDELQHLQSHVPQPKKQYDLCQERVQVRTAAQSPGAAHWVEDETPKPCWVRGLHLLRSGQCEKSVDPEPCCWGIL